MKNVLKMTGVIALALVITMAMAACSGGGGGGGSGNPKSLAKEAYELTKEAFTVGAGTDVDAAEAYMKKLEAHQEKVGKLSEEQRKVFESEVLKLYEENK